MSSPKLIGYMTSKVTGRIHDQYRVFDGGGGIAPCANADGSDKVPHIPVKLKIDEELLKQLKMKISPVAFTNNCIGGGIHPTENSAAIIANYGSNRPTNFHGNPGVLCMIDMEEIRPFMYDDYNSKFRDDELAGTLTTNIGASSLRGGQKVCIPVLTPDRIEKRQNGRRMKENGDPSFTLTAQDIHGVALGVIRQSRNEYGKAIRKDYEEGTIELSRHEFLESEIREDGMSNTIDTVTKDNLLALDTTEIIKEGSCAPTGVQAGTIVNPEGVAPTVMQNHGTVTATPLKVKNNTTQGYDEADIGDSVNLALPNSKTRRDRVGHQVSQTLDCSCNMGVVVTIDVESKDTDHPGLYIQLAEDFIIYAVWYEKYQCYITVRKLTPRECFRLQGWTDDYFDKAQFVNSDSQLYKQAGNGITVNVVEYIGNLLN